MLKRIISIVICILFFVSYFAPISYADELEEFSYIPNIINRDLAIRSSEYAMLAYDEYKWDEQNNTYVVKDRDKERAKSYGSTVLHDKLVSQGFNSELIIPYNYADGIDHNVSFELASKEVMYFGEPKTLLVAIIRGTDGVEWKGNMDVTYDRYGAESTHTSFSQAANDVIEALSQYIKDIDKHNNILLVTGHSRGAAVANIVAHRINNNENAPYYSEMGINSLFAYTFATPNVATDVDSNNTYDSNIFNFCFNDDFVPQVPIKAWGYDKYGKTFTAVAENLHKNDFRFEFDMNIFVRNSVHAHNEAEFNYEGTQNLISYVSNKWPDLKNYYCDYYTVNDPNTHDISLYNFFRNYVADAANEQFFDQLNVFFKQGDTVFGPIAEFFVNGGGSLLYKHYIYDSHLMFTYLTALKYDGFDVNYPIENLTLNISSTNGTVSRSSIKDKYYSGEIVTLTATPDPGYIFTGWTGDINSLNLTTRVTMDSDKNIKANFVEDSDGNELENLPLNTTTDKEPNSDITKAQDITVHSEVTGEITTEDNDYYKMVLTSDGYIHFEFTGVDFHGRLAITKAGEGSDDIPGISSSDSITQCQDVSLKAGIYYLNVHCSDGWNETGNYSFLTKYSLNANNTSADYIYTVKDNKAHITRYTGTGGDITIPGTLGGVTVTNFGDSPYIYDNGFPIKSIRFNSATITIYDSDHTIPAVTKIIGYTKSTARDYATKYHRTFIIQRQRPQLGNVMIESGGDWYTVGLKSDGTVVSVGRGDNGQCNTTAANGFTDIVAISAGYNHTVGLKNDGTVVAVGDNKYGQCETTTSNGFTDIVAISAGSGFTVGLKGDGTVVAVGTNQYGECNTTAANGFTDIVDISAGYDHTVGLKSDGTVVAIGDNTNGQCGTMEINGQLEKVPANGFTDIVAIAAGGEVTIGLKSDGTVVQAGAFVKNQFTDIVAIAAGVHHIVGLKNDGTVEAIGGYNAYGELDTTIANGFFGISAISAGGQQSVGLKSDGTIVTAGKDDYDYYEYDHICWNELPDISWNLLNAPQNRPIVTISATDPTAKGPDSFETATDTGTFTLTRSGSTNSPLDVYYLIHGSAIEGLDYGQIARLVTIPAGVTTIKITITPISGTERIGSETVIGTLYANSYYTIGNQYQDTVTIYSKDQSYVKVSAVDATASESGTDTGTFTVIRNDGRTDCALDVNYSVSGSATPGIDYTALSGTVTIPNGETKAIITVTPHEENEKEDAETVIVTLSASSNYIIGSPGSATVNIVENESGLPRPQRIRPSLGNIMVAAGDHHTIGLKSEGTVIAAGNNFYGQCNTTEANGFSDIVAIATNIYHTVGLKSDGTVVAVGLNLYGQCDTSSANGFTDIVAIAAGVGNTVGLKSDGTVVSIGRNYYGECDTTAANGFSDILAIAAHGFYTVGLKSDGTVVTVGENCEGRNTTIANGFTDVVAIAVRNNITVGLRSNGTVVAVGKNITGECDTTEAKGFTDIRSITAGGYLAYHTAGLKSDGTVVTVGDNTYGQRDTTEANGFTDLAAISAGSQHTVGLKSNGKVVAVGDNTQGQCNTLAWKLSEPSIVLEGIAITAPANKLIFNIGDSLVITGLVVTGTYSDGSTKVESITTANVTGFNSTVAAKDQILTITVGDKTATYKVQILAANSDYEYTVTDGKAQITKYKGSGGNITIPSTLGGFPVTSIGDWAFSYFTSITAISLHQGIASIGNYAFSNCKGLSTISIPKEVTSIGSGAFSSCGGLTTISVVADNSNYTSINGVLYNRAGTVLIECPGGLTTVSIHQGVTNISKAAFEGCTKLTIISIPQGVTSIGNQAFAMCTGLTSISIPQGVASIGDQAFYSCVSLPTISLPQEVTSIGFGAFDSCIGLTTINIPEGVTSIGDETFQGCTSLTTISVPEGVTSISGIMTFYGCTGLTSIRFNSATTIIYDSKYTIPDQAKIIGYDPSTAKAYATKYNRTFEVISATNTLKSIAITSPAIKLIYNIGDKLDITGLEVTGTYSDGSTKVERITTANITGFNSTVAAKDQILTITVGGKTANYKVQILATNSDYEYTVTDGKAQITKYTGPGGNVTIPSTLGGVPVTSIGYKSFADCINITALIIPQGVTSIDDYAFYDCTGLNAIVIPQGVTSIGDGAFYWCKGLTTINIPQGVTSIGGYIFYNCTSLATISLPQGVTSIGEDAFYWCKGLTGIIIPQGVISIGGYAFHGCTGLNTISIPQGVTNIGWASFYECTGLTSIRFNSATTTIYDSPDTIPATTKIIGYNSSTAKTYATKYYRMFESIGDQKSSDKDITGVTVPKQVGSSTIDPSNHTISFHMPYGTSVKKISPIITVSALAKISPKSKAAQNFTEPVIYKVTAQDGTSQDWTITCIVDPKSSANDITGLTVPKQVGSSTINSTNHTISFHMPSGSNVNKIAPTITISALSTINPKSKATQNFTNPVIYTVTAQNGTSQDWIVTCIVDPKSSAKDITAFTVPKQVGSSTLDSTNHTIGFHMLYGTKVNKIAPTITISALATINPKSKAAQNFTEPVIYKVTAQDGTSQDWTITCIVDPKSSANDM